MKSIPLSALLLFFGASLSFAGPIPPDVAEFVRLEQGYNCYLPQGKLPDGRPVIVKLPPIPEDQRAPFKVFYWNLPRHQVGEQHIYASRFIDDPLLNFAMTQRNGSWENGDTLVKSFVPETNPKQVQISRDSLGREPDGFFEAVKIQGRDSAVGWDPNNMKGRKYIFKFGGDYLSEDGKTTTRLLGPTTIERAVRMSDVVEQILRDEGAGGIAGMLPERYGTWIGDYGVIIREMRNVGLEIPAGEGFGVPLHSLLSNEGFTLTSITSEARYSDGSRGGITQWIVTEFLPKLAIFVAQLQLLHGIIPELHTQNIKVIFAMDPQTHTPTGEIIGFVFTDMTDVAIDVGFRAFSQRPHHLEELLKMRSPSIMNFKVMGEKEIADPARHLLAFLSQSIGSSYFLSLPKDPKAWAALPAEYFEEHEAALYQVYVEKYFECVEEWMAMQGIPSSGFLGAMRQQMQQGIVVAAPPNQKNLPGKGQRTQLSMAEAMAQIRPSQGQYVLKLLADISSLLPKELAQLAVIKEQQNVAGAKRRRDKSILRSEFLALFKKNQVAYYDSSLVGNVQMFQQPTMEFIEIPKVGIVAYIMMTMGQLHYPGVFAVALPDRPSSTISLCSEAVLAGGDIVWSNRHIPKQKELLRRWGLIPKSLE